MKFTGFTDGADHPYDLCLKKVSSIVLAAQLCLLTTSSANEGDVPAPPAFTANCAACHLLDQTVVGPSLVEIANTYPKKKRADFVQWCIDPGKKREDMAQMPSMAHIPEEELIEVYDYIHKVTAGVVTIRKSKGDPYANSPLTTRRPRIQRTFIPHTGPASMFLALPTKDKLNVIWDTDKCRLRYISQGKADHWPYVKGNGAAEAKMGKVIYTESKSIFDSEEVQYLGYHVSKEGYPTFIYTVDNVEIAETITVESESIKRVIKSSSKMPEHTLPVKDGAELKTKAEASGGVITITHTSS